MGRGYKHGVTLYDKQNFAIKQYGSESELLADVCAENTIGIISYLKITGWSIGAEEPSDCSTGMVWIITGNKPQYAFNALKEGELWVYPVEGKLYFNGEWRYVPTYAVKQGVWTHWWNGQLTVRDYDITYITGGWQAVADAGDTGMNANAPTITWTSYMNVKLTGYRQRGYVTSGKLVDVTRFNQIEVEVHNLKISGNDSKISFEIVDNSGNSVRAQSVTEKQTYAIDISDLTGEYYVRLYVIAANYGSVTLDISRITLL